jgi:hypothetical protein
MFVYFAITPSHQNYTFANNPLENWYNLETDNILPGIVSLAATWLRRGYRDCASFTRNRDSQTAPPDRQWFLNAPWRELSCPACWSTARSGLVVEAPARPVSVPRQRGKTTTAASVWKAWWRGSHPSHLFFLCQSQNTCTTQQRERTWEPRVKAIRKKEKRIDGSLAEKEKHTQCSGLCEKRRFQERQS